MSTAFCCSYGQVLVVEKKEENLCQEHILIPYDCKEEVERNAARPEERRNHKELNEGSQGEASRPGVVLFNKQPGLAKCYEKGRPQICATQNIDVHSRDLVISLKNSFYFSFHLILRKKNNLSALFSFILSSDWIKQNKKWFRPLSILLFVLWGGGGYQKQQEIKLA